MSVVVAERYPATVTDNQDPDNRGRVRVACAALLGDENATLPMWAEPALDWGWFYVPDVGEIIEVTANTGSTEDEQEGQMSIDNLDLKWYGTRFYGGTEGDTPTPIAEEFKTNYGKRRGFATPSGLIIFFDDTDDKRQINLTWNDGKDPPGFTYLSIDKDGSIVMGTKSGHMFYMNTKDGEVSLIDEHGNTISTSSDGLKLIDYFGNIFEMKDGAIQILGQGGVTVSAKDVVIDAGKTQLGGQPAVEPVILGNIFMQFFANHIHPTGTGPSGPALIGAGGNPLQWQAALSTFVNTR